MFNNFLFFWKAQTLNFDTQSNQLKHRIHFLLEKYFFIFFSNLYIFLSKQIKKIGIKKIENKELDKKKVAIAQRRCIDQKTTIRR